MKMWVVLIIAVVAARAPCACAADYRTRAGDAIVRSRVAVQADKDASIALCAVSIEVKNAMVSLDAAQSRFEALDAEYDAVLVSVAENSAILRDQSGLLLAETLECKEQMEHLVCVSQQVYCMSQSVACAASQLDCAIDGLKMAFLVRDLFFVGSFFIPGAPGVVGAMSVPIH